MIVTVDLTDGYLIGRPRQQMEVELPDGWRRVWRGAVLPGDKFLNVVLARDGIVSWEDVYDPAVIGRSYKTAEYHTCLIRRGADGPDKACEQSCLEGEHNDRIA